MVNAVFQGKIHWFWGDTNRPDYPLGNFHVPGATSELPGQGGLDPDAGVNLSYFLDDKGFARPTAPLPGEGPTWISGLVVLPDRGARTGCSPTMSRSATCCRSTSTGSSSSTRRRIGSRRSPQFPSAAGYPGDYPERPRIPLQGPRGRLRLLRHSLSPGPGPGGSRAAPRPVGVRVVHVPEGRHEAVAAAARPRRGRRAPLRLEAAHAGPAAGPAGPADRRRPPRPDEALLNLRDVETGKTVLAHGGSVYWNAYRGRWVMIAVESSGSTSFLGEIWYAEADTPLGPWVYARKVVTHDKYSFYNPKQHPMFDKDGGRIIFFEGTYTTTFSGNDDPTPRYDYNQVMYRLDLSDGRLALPVAVYEVPAGGGSLRLTTRAGRAEARRGAGPPRRVLRPRPAGHREPAGLRGDRTGRRSRSARRDGSRIGGRARPRAGVLRAARRSRGPGQGHGPAPRDSRGARWKAFVLGGFTGDEEPRGPRSPGPGTGLAEPVNIIALVIGDGRAGRRPRGC